MHYETSPKKGFQQKPFFLALKNKLIKPDSQLLICPIMQVIEIRLYFFFETISIVTPLLHTINHSISSRLLIILIKAHTDTRKGTKFNWWILTPTFLFNPFFFLYPKMLFILCNQTCQSNNILLEWQMFL